jgi:hypothetical protein
MNVPEQTFRRFSDPSYPIKPGYIFTKSNFLVGYVDGNGVLWGRNPDWVEKVTNPNDAQEIEDWKSR